MLYRIKIISLLLTFLFVALAKAQDKTVDSLKLALKNAKHDTTRCIVLYALSELASEEEWPGFNEQLINLTSRRIGDKRLSANEARVFKFYYAKGYQNKGFLFYSKGDIPNALTYYNKCLLAMDKLQNVKAAADVQFAIAYIYIDQHDFQEAAKLFRKCLVNNRPSEDLNLASRCIIGIGNVYRGLGRFDTALIFYKRNYDTCLNFQYLRGMSTSLNNMATIYIKQAEYEKAVDILKKAELIEEKVGNKEALAGIYNNFSGIYIESKKYELALKYALKSFEIATKFGLSNNLVHTSLSLSNIYKKLNNHKLAFEKYEFYIKMRDSLINIETQKATVKQQLKYEYEKQAVADSVTHAKESEVKNAELARQKAEIKTKKNQQYALYGGLGLVMVFAGFMYNRFKVTQKQKMIIEEKEKETQKQNEIITQQKHEVEEKQKEILDSITYARRIQRALITSEKYVDKALNRLAK